METLGKWAEQRRKKYRHLCISLCIYVSRYTVHCTCTCTVYMSDSKLYCLCMHMYMYMCIHVHAHDM